MIQVSGWINQIPGLRGLHTHDVSGVVCVCMCVRAHGGFGHSTVMEWSSPRCKWRLAGHGATGKQQWSSNVTHSWWGRSQQQRSCHKTLMSPNPPLYCWSKSRAIRAYCMQQMDTDGLFPILLFILESIENNQVNDISILLISLCTLALTVYHWFRWAVR